MDTMNKTLEQVKQEILLILETQDMPTSSYRLVEERIDQLIETAVQTNQQLEQLKSQDN